VLKCVKNENVKVCQERKLEKSLEENTEYTNYYIFTGTDGFDVISDTVKVC